MHRAYTVIGQEIAGLKYTQYVFTLAYSNQIIYHNQFVTQVCQQKKMTRLYFIFFDSNRFFFKGEMTIGWIDL